MRYTTLMRRKMATFNTKKLIHILLAIFLVLALSLVIAEVALRVLPIPGIEIRSGKFDETVGTIYHPHSNVI